MSRKVIHVTSVHRWDDVRIFHKMARSLAHAGYYTHLVALDRKASAEREFVVDGVSIHLMPGADIGSRFGRALTGARRVAACSRALGGDIVHFARSRAHSVAVRRIGRQSQAGLRRA